MARCSWVRRCEPPCLGTRSVPCSGSRISQLSTAASRSSSRLCETAWRRRARQLTMRTRRVPCPTHNSGLHVQTRQFLSLAFGRFSSPYKCERLIFIVVHEYCTAFLSACRVETCDHFPPNSSVSFPYKVFENAFLCTVPLQSPLVILFYQLSIDVATTNNWLFYPYINIWCSLGVSNYIIK